MSTFHEALEQLEAMRREEARHLRAERRSAGELLHLISSQRSSEACRSQRQRQRPRPISELPQETT